MPNGILCLALLAAFSAAPEPPAIDPLVRTVDLNIGETAEVKLCDGSKTTVKLLSLDEIRDPIRQAVREARVAVLVNGQRADLVAAFYRLPREAGGVQIDCAVTRGCVQPGRNAWALDKDARIRLWPADFPELLQPRYDVVYLRDARGWYHRYSHLHTIDPAVRPGDYLVRVERSNDRGETATARLHVRVEGP